MTETPRLGGSFSLPNSGITLRRLGYGAMRLSGPGIMGPPEDRQAAIALLREAVERGVNHIDTADFYGPHVTNHIIREALHPYPEGLTLVTKVGIRRSSEGEWLAAQSPEEITAAVHDNLRNLQLDVLDVVNLRVMIHGVERAEGSIARQLEPLFELQRRGLIRHVGLSSVTPSQIREAQTMGDIVCVQNLYNLAHRQDDALIDELRQQGIAYVPFFPLGGFSPVQSGALEAIARQLIATPLQVALAWLLQRAPNILLIPGTSSQTHLRENLDAAQLFLSAEAIRTLESSF